MLLQHLKKHAMCMHWINISFEGFITFGEHNIMIEYNKPESKVLTYFEDTLTIQDQSGYTTVNVQSMCSL